MQKYGTVIAKTVLHDWQETEKGKGNLSEKQKIPWPITIKRGSYDQIWVEATAPDGSKKTVALEKDQGVLKVLLYSDKDETMGVIWVLPDRLHMLLTDENGQEVSYEWSGQGLKKLSREAPEPTAFGEESPTPAAKP
jgi:hypothetical protein